jgi:hypothetical protein
MPGAYPLGTVPEDVMDPNAWTELLEKRAITEQLYVYCRAIDRMDKELLRGVFAAELVAQYSPDHVARGVDQLIDWLWSHHLAFHGHSHQLANVLIELDHDRAVSEAYLHARLMRRLGGGRLELYTVMGRHLDRWQKREGVWRIAHRRFLTDFFEIRETADLLPEGASFAVRDPDDIRRDPSYELFATRPRASADG